jgi:hypothetical protein
MAGYRLWDSERTESIPIDDARATDDMIYDVTVPRTLLQAGADADAAQSARAQRILGADFALLELEDTSTVLVELLNGDAILAGPQPASASPKTLRCLIIG